MSNNNSNPAVTNCRFIGNSASGNGGGMSNNNHSTPTVTNCRFSGNSVSEIGGGMFNNSGSHATVINCTFSGNSEGGMYNAWFSNPVVINCTFYGNSVPFVGGGIRDADGSSTVTNCILWDNGSSPIYETGHGTTVVNYSVVQGGWTGAGNIDADPLFVDADGPDNILGTDDDDLRLLSGSPCIDAGDNSAVPIGLIIDLLGNPRFVDDPATPEGGVGPPPIVDLGAYEFD